MKTMNLLKYPKSKGNEFFQGRESMWNFVGYHGALDLKNKEKKVYTINLKFFKSDFKDRKKDREEFKYFKKFFILTSEHDILYPEKLTRKEVEEKHINKLILKPKEEVDLNLYAFNEIPYGVFTLEIECTATSEDGKTGVFSEFISIFSPFPAEMLD